MSLQVQSSQPAAAPSGRRTPQVYQNLVATPPTAPASATPTPPTNGSSNKPSSGNKLSLKGSTSGKSSPAASSGKASPAPAQPTVTVTPATPQSAPIVAIVDLVGDEKVASPAKATAEKKEVTNGKDTNGKHEEAAKESPRKETKASPKASPRATPQKSIPVEQVKTPETVSPKKPAASAAKEVKEAAVAAEPAKKKVDNSLVGEKTLKGFTAEGDEMESLVVEPSEYEDSPMPPRTGGKSKLLKGGPPTRARISPFRVAQEAVAVANASTVVNLSTVSEGQHAESNESSPAVDFNRPLRAISGRRSTRPLTDIQFSYRKPTADLNDSSSSLNVTVGSEIHNDSLRTPAGSSRKRKAMTPESTSDALDVKEHTDSPKRTRLDFSGFLGIVASPVTMLKNRFSRVRLHASTPVAKRSFETEEDLVGKVVTAEATTTTANISGGAAADNKMEVEPAAETADKTEQKPEESSTTIKDGQTDVPASEDASTAEEAKEDSVEVKDVTDKQRRCVIM